MIIEGKTVRETLLEEIANIGDVPFFSFAEQNRFKYRQWREHGLINDSEIEESLDKYALSEARKDFKYVVLRNLKPNSHNIEPEFLVYGIKKGIFSDGEIAQIPGLKTIEGFVKRYENINLLSDLRKELLNSKTPSKIPTRDICSSCDCY